jgi:FMN phosphatase YigB (HAD superfamily)
MSVWLKAVIFDLGQTIVEENTSLDHPKLMPGVREAIDGIALPMGIWANTRESTSADVRKGLSAVGIDAHFRWIVTSYEIGHRKPAPEFFGQALAQSNLRAAQVLFVGNQLNTDIIGAQSVGIATVYLTDPAYRSIDDALTPQAKPTFTIPTLFELPALVTRLVSGDP